ncbi:MAG: hypothetical protein D6705_18750 [Deltaproteobacteria bacterium]|nr:MAG: hypothetical protein D6705_18750 [Deltaproteobacteria bacterium]
MTLAPAASNLPEWLVRLPKAELHVHLEGSVTPERLASWLRRDGGASRCPPSAADLRRAFRRIRDMPSFVASYVEIMRAFDRPSRFAEAVADLAARFGAFGFVRLEVTVTAAAYVALWRIDPRGLVEGLLEGRLRARALGVDVAFVPDVVRTLPETVEPTLAFADALRHADEGALAAVGLAGPEPRRPPPRVEETCRLLVRRRPSEVPVVPHAGEFGTAEGVRWAIEALGAPRIGHGIAVLEDPATVALARARGTVFEVCPDSNLRLGAAGGGRHPLRSMLRAGLGVVLATDDPGIFELSPLASYAFALDRGVPAHEIVAMAERSLRASLGRWDRDAALRTLTQLGRRILLGRTPTVRPCSPVPWR